MELDDSSTYAVGALFTLALHSTQLRTGVAGPDPLTSNATAWGQHSQRIIVTTDEDSDEVRGASDAAWDRFWGYDCLLLLGLCERIFKGLGIPESSWEGLKVLPEVAAAGGYGELVKQYRGVLDRSLADMPAPSVQAGPPRNQQGQQAASESAADMAVCMDEDDEDLAGDLARARLASKQENLSPLGQRTSWESRGSAKTSSGSAACAAGNVCIAAAGREDLGASVGASRVEKADTLPGSGDNNDSRPASELAKEASLEGVPTAQAFAAVTQLLDACVSNLDMPTVQDVVKGVEGKEKGQQRPQNVQKAEQRGAEKAVNVRWYDSRAREALVLVAEWLQVPWQKVVLYEALYAQQAQVQTPELKGDGKKQLSAREKRMRALKVGAAAAGGGALLALTGGLAAPALAAVAGTVMTTVGGSAAAAGAVTGLMGSSVGAAAIIGGFGYGGAKVVGGKMARRIGDVKEFGFREIPEDGNYKSSYSAHVPSQDVAESPALDFLAAESTQASGSHQSGNAATPEDSREGSTLTQGNADVVGKGKDASASGSWFGSGSKGASSWLPWSKSEPEVELPALLPVPVPTKPRADPKLALTIAVAGWIAAPGDFEDVWRHLSTVESERFTLVWETKELIQLNNSIMNMLLNQAASRAGKYLIENFVIHGLVAAVALPMTVLSVSSLIDSTWAVVMNRAARAGELLAHVLMSGAHGDRPINLVGYSMGSRLIFYCLLELCRCECKGIVQHAVMLGTPVDVVPERWAMARSVVAGRCINGYSKEDWVLALSFRARQTTFRPAAGLGPVAVTGIENVDLSSLVNGHGDYIKRIDDVLDALGLAQPVNLR